MKLLLTGDYFYDYESQQDDFTELKHEFSSYDYVILNYEGSLKSSSISKKAVNLSMSKQSCELPRNCVLCLANNHIFDYTQHGMIKTKQYFEHKQLKYFGIESKRNEFDNFIILEDIDLKVCVCAFGWVNEECVLSTKKLPGNVNFTRENIDKVFNKLCDIHYDKLIIYCHYGYEYEYYPLPLHVDLFRYMIDLGADLIYSSHSHIIQPYEIYKEKYIFYGLGNFYFASRRDIYPTSSDKGLLLELDINSQEIDIKTQYVNYDRTLKRSIIFKNCDYFQKYFLKINSFYEYSKEYKDIRIRKKNPRPILYKDSDFMNNFKFILWKLIVDITGFFKIRQIVKKILGW